jgi:hypothetical protein
MSGTNLALSIRQPWAELILLGRKTLELRTWIPDYRGPLWLHTGKAENPGLERLFGLSDLPRGAFVGRFDLTDVAPLDPGRWERWRDQHRDPGPYIPGTFAWVIEGAERLPEPVPASGKLKVYEVDDDVARTLRAALPARTG